MEGSPQKAESVASIGPSTRLCVYLSMGEEATLYQHPTLQVSSFEGCFGLTGLNW